MKKKALIALAAMLAILALGGCTGTRQSIVEITEEDLKNAEASRQVAINMLKVWPINSGFIRGALGSRIDELPAQALSAMSYLDRMAENINERSDHTLGYSLGLQVRLRATAVKEALERIAPEILMLMPAIW